MKGRKYYTVAQHTFCVEVSDNLPVDNLMRPYQPFAETEAKVPLFSLQIEVCRKLPLEQAGGLVRRFDDDAAFIWLYKRGDRYAFGFSNHIDVPMSVLVVDPNFRNGKLFVGEAQALSLLAFGINNSLMLLFALNTARLNTLLIHASVIRYRGNGLVFLGKSGTGKSTHARLWLENVEDTSLLNDDNPVIRLEDDNVFVYGSPWSGKTPCYKNERIKLKAIVRLSQAPMNRIVKLNRLEAYASLISSCSCMKWVRSMSDGVCDTVEKVIGQCGCYFLECLPDKQAALLALHTVGTVEV